MFVDTHTHIYLPELSAEIDQVIARANANGIRQFFLPNIDSSSIDAVFKLGQGMVIKGWDEGIALLKVGGKALLIIPSDLAYGSRGAGGVIPPFSPLTFEVELVSVQ